MNAWTLVFTTMCVGLLNSYGPVQYTSTELHTIGQQMLQHRTADRGHYTAMYGTGKHRGRRGGRIKQLNRAVPARVTPRHHCHTAAVMPRKKCLVHVQHAAAANTPCAMLCNARSLNANGLTIKDQISNIRPVLVFITETWNKPNDGDYNFRNTLPDTYMWHNADRETRRGGGVAIAYDHRAVCTEISRNTTTYIEYIWCSTTIDTTSMDIITMYRPPNSSVSQFLDAFHSLISRLNEHRRPVVITGDFNFHMDDATNQHANNFKDILQEFNLMNHVTCATHTAGHTLDLVITRMTSSVVMNVTSNDIISDHLSVLFDFNLITPSTKQEKMRRDINGIDIEAFKIDLQQSELCCSTPTSNEEIVQLYNTTLQELIDVYAPVTRKTVSRRLQAPWYSDEIHQERQKRRQLTRVWKKSKTENHKLSMLNQRDLVRRKTEDAKLVYYAEAIAESIGDSKLLFRKLNELLNNRQTNPLPSTRTDAENAEDFNVYFIDKIKKLKERFSEETVNTDIAQDTCTTTFTTFKKLECEKVKSLISAAPNKQCDLDPVPTCILKQCTDIIAPVITTIINNSLAKGTVPDAFKTAIVKPLLKKPGLETIHKNYRPLSNLAFVSKLIEQCVIDQLEGYYEENELSDPFQSAYKPFHSTETALLHIVNDILWRLDTGELVLMAMLDLSAAFDTIDHDIIIRRLRTTQGLDGNVIQWIESYLRDRTQRVKVDNTLSASRMISEGAVQGSKIGCRLYSKYVEPLGQAIRNGSCLSHAYADDNSIWKPVTAQSSIVSAKQELEDTLETCRKWMFDNKLCLNESKTEFIIFGRKHRLRNLPNITLSLGDASITASGNVRNLGAVLDSELSFHDHVSKVCSVCNFHIHRAWKIRKYITEDAAIKLMLATVISRLDYCNAILTNIQKKEINRLQKIQNAAARCISMCDRRSSITPVLKRLHWLPVEYRVRYKLLTTVHKCVYGNAPMYLKQLLQEYRPARTLRSTCAKLLTVPKTRSSMGDRCFSVAGPTEWNKLPNALRNLPSFSCFKKHLKTYLFDLAYS